MLRLNMNEKSELFLYSRREKLIKEVKSKYPNKKGLILLFSIRYMLFWCFI